MSNFEFCTLTNNKTDILRDLSDINNTTDSKSILSSIIKIKNNLEKNNTCETRKLAKKQIGQLKRLERLYKNFKGKKHTDLTNKRIEELFGIDKININNLDYLEKGVKEIINDENNNLEDNFFDKSFRDNVEKNINFKGDFIHGTYNETPEMEEFLNLFTIEYINFLRKKKIKKENKLKKKILEKQKKQEKLKIHKLFKKYFGNKEIKNRGDINSMEFMKKLYNAIDRGEINQSQKQKILQYGYYLAFKSEIKSIKGKKGIENIKKYEKQWKDIFYNELKNIITEENAKNLFLLSWIEGNGQDQSKNPFGAIGWFQILLSTAKSIDKSITEKDLHDPIKSAKIAAKYIKILIEKEKNNNPNLDEITIIKKAITKYNGNFSSRLLESKRTNIDKTIFELFKELNWIKTKINSYKSINEIKEKLKYIHKKYFKPKENENSFHFGILEKKEITREKIVNWINRYIKQILKQQSMYPIQFNAIKKIYNEIKKAN